MKRVTDFQHVKSVTAKALIFDGKPAGRIIANWSDNPAGTVCSASVIVWAGPLKDAKHPKTGKGLNYGNIGKAGGYGYDKLSAAVYHCLVNAGIEPETVRSGNGQTDEEFINRGYIIFDIC
jgi:hypothetical protein